MIFKRIITLSSILIVGTGLAACGHSTTKEATKSFSSVSLNILSSVAANVLTGLVKQASGLNF